MSMIEPEVSWPPNPSFARLRVLPLALAFALGAMLVAYPPMRGMETDGAESGAFKDSIVTAFRYFAVDTFYYLGVADRSAEAGMFTFDGEHRTNGFHPLWQIVLAYSFRVFGLAGSQTSQIGFAFGLGILLVAAGCGLVAMTTWRLTRSLPLCLWVVAPGPYYVLTRLHGMGMHYGSMWSYINGMESPLTIFFFGAVLFLLATRWTGGDSLSRSDALALGFLGAFMTLARLDDVFIFAGLLAAIFILAEDRTSVERYVRAGILLAPPAVLVGGYILFNLWTVGTAMPVSGVAKSGFALGQNLLDTLQMFIPYDIALSHPANYVNVTWRAMQVCLPAAAALVVLGSNLARFRPKNPGPMTPAPASTKLLAFVGIYVLIKAAYNFVNVKYVHQGHWYFPAAVIYFNLAVTLPLAEWMSGGTAASQAAPSPLRRKLFSVAVVLFVLFSTIQFTQMKRSSSYQINLYQLWKAGPSVAASLRAKYSGKGFVEFDDGIISYALEIPALSGLGFTLDREAFDAKEAGRLLPLAYERGYRVFTSYQYMPPIPIADFKDGEKLREHLRRYWAFRNTALTRAENVDQWDFRVVAVHPTTPQLIFIGFEPRSVPPEKAGR